MATEAELIAVQRNRFAKQLNATADRLGEERRPSPKLQTLYERIEKGMTWLTEHDPTGAFHLWFKAGLAPNSPMPTQPDERKAEWRAYFTQRSRWESLWREMQRMERLEGLSTKPG